MELTVVTGPDPLMYWRAHSACEAPAAEARVRLLEFVRDVRPLYAASNIVLVPTPVSAGTNVKVLEAMAMERAVVSTTPGCAGLGLTHGSSVWIADTAEDFAEGIARVVGDPALRREMALAARQHAERYFDWRELGARQRALWRELLQPPVCLRPASEEDLEEIRRIQSLAPEASHWEPQRYLAYDCRVACAGPRVAGFVVVRRTAANESEILNLAVLPEFRRMGIATGLVRNVLERYRGAVFLEVRESNQAAQTLYQKLSFRQAGRRPGYYEDPPEAAIVMRFQSC